MRHRTIYVSPISCPISGTIVCNFCLIWFAFSQLKLINKTISSAKQGSPLYWKPLLEDPSERIVESHLATLEWHMQSRKFGMTAAKLKKLQISRGSWIVEIQLSRKEWRDNLKHMEIQESAQHSAQGEGVYRAWLVVKLQHSRTRTLSYWLLLTAQTIKKYF